MKKGSFDVLVRALNEANVPFIVVGGIAVIHHGYGRMTQDIDLVLHLQRDIILRAFQALFAVGYRPAVPITAEQFADSALREKWKREKGMKVLKFWSDQHRDTPVDVFIDEPFDFAKELSRADVRDSLPGLPIHIVSLQTLLQMKRAAGRAQDIADIDELNLLHGTSSSYDNEA